MWTCKNDEKGSPYVVYEQSIRDGLLCPVRMFQPHIFGKELCETSIAVNSPMDYIEQYIR